MNKRNILIAFVASLTLGLAACGKDTSTPASVNQEQKVADKQLDQALQNQPVPSFNYSQLRQNLIEIETAQANSIVTTTFFMNQGKLDPDHTCPSIGFPIPASYQLTNPNKVVNKAGEREYSSAVIAQIEATGVYTAGSTGTYVICVAEDGSTYADYFEGFVHTVTAPAKWDYTNHNIVVTGKSTGKFSTGQK